MIQCKKVNARDFWREMSAFQAYMRSRNLSSKTIHSYNRCLARFHEWLTAEFGEDADVTAKHIRAYMAHRFEVGNKPLTVRSYVIALAAFFSFLVADEIIPEQENPMRLIKPPKKTGPEIEPLTPEQVRNLLDSFDKKSPAQHRDFVMCLLLLDTGLRAGEIIRLTLGDVNLEDSSLKVDGKGRRPRRVYMGRKMCQIVLDYMEKRRPEIANGHGTLFPPTGRSTKAAMTITYFSGIVRNKMDEVGIPRANSSPHRLRHTFAVNFIRGGGDAFSLQRLLGHSTLTMTERYVRLAEDDVAAAHRRASPVDRMAI